MFVCAYYAICFRLFLFHSLRFLKDAQAKNPFFCSLLSPGEGLRLLSFRNDCLLECHSIAVYFKRKHQWNLNQDWKQFCWKCRFRPEFACAWGFVLFVWLACACLVPPCLFSAWSGLLSSAGCGRRRRLPLAFLVSFGSLLVCFACGVKCVKFRAGFGSVLHLGG